MVTPKCHERTDRQTDAAGIINMSPPEEGRRHNDNRGKIYRKIFLGKNNACNLSDIEISNFFTTTFV